MLSIGLAPLYSKFREAKKFTADSHPDPDLMIYSGGFFSAADKQVMNTIRALKPEELADYLLLLGSWHIGKTSAKYCLSAPYIPET
jgi:exodeoxyribonuclease-1